MVELNYSLLVSHKVHGTTCFVLISPRVLALQLFLVALVLSVVFEFSTASCVGETTACADCVPLPFLLVMRFLFLFVDNSFLTELKVHLFIKLFRHFWLFEVNE